MLIMRLLVPLVAATAVAGCAVKVDPVQTLPGASASPTKSGPFVGKYTRLKGECPTLDGKVAERLKVPATGKRGADDIDDLLGLLASCSWGDGIGSVGVVINLDRQGGIPNAEERTAQKFEASHQQDVKNGFVVLSKPVSGIGEKAYSGVYGDGQNLILQVRDSNAEIQLRYVVAEMEPRSYASALDKKSGDLVALARDVLDDLE
jgi:hypothetical protein